MGLATFDSRFVDPSTGTTLPRAFLAAKFPSSVGDTTPPAAGVALGVKALAEANAGRWIARCPFCTGAEYVSLTDPVFFCHECRNATVGSQLVAVELPPAKTREQIERYLLARPVPASRDWRPGETVKDLQAENRSLGVRLGGAS